MGSCHPESDSVGRWAEPEQAGRLLPARQHPPSAGHPTSQPPLGRPGSQTRAAPNLPLRAVRGLDVLSSWHCRWRCQGVKYYNSPCHPGPTPLHSSGFPSPPSPVPFAPSAGPGLNCPSDTPPGGNLIFVDPCAWLSASLPALCTLHGRECGRGGAGCQPSCRKEPVGLGGQPGARDRCPGLAAGSARSCGQGGHGQGRARPDSLAFSVAFFPLLFLELHNGRQKGRG